MPTTNSKILVVEDDPQLSMTYGILLKKEGYSVEHAYNGLEALSKVDSYLPELILLDIRMPKMDGIEFLKQARLPKHHPNIKVIVFSNMDQTAELEEVKDLGAHRSVLKSSVSPTQLAQLVRETLVS